MPQSEQLRRKMSGGPDSWVLKEEGLGLAYAYGQEVMVGEWTDSLVRGKKELGDPAPGSWADRN